MAYTIQRKQQFDFIGQSYASSYPNLHKYPATMLPQIGIELFKELNIKQGKLLDPYCGSGSSFTVGLDRGFTEMDGFDINPLAVLISRAKFTKIDLERIKLLKQRLRNKIYDFVKIESDVRALALPNIYNIDFWFKTPVSRNLTVIKHFIDKIKEKDIKRMFLIPFSESVRECSLTRNSEFKLFRMKTEDILNFNPDVFGIYFYKLNKVIETYEKYYYPYLDNTKIEISYSKFPQKQNYYDVVLTSPPYGDSRTTVAYGQFSILSNEWMGIKYARKVDSKLMGGYVTDKRYSEGLISDYIEKIAKVSLRRSWDVSAFYRDLDSSIKDVSKSIKKNGLSIYVVGNRTVKNTILPTDQFIAEKFEQNGFKHLLTYERLLGNKAMPSQNSPSNIPGQRKSTMTKEYIVICEKTTEN
ncbi:MAG: modification methylase [Ignavibacteriaceae bacterium]|nr:modification methylase [Ignavibacteriaceae bacterium]